MSDQPAFDGIVGRNSSSSGPRSSFDRVEQAATRLNLRITRVRNDEIFIACPLHEDRTPSLHVTWSSGGASGGLTLLQCHACQGRFADLVAGLDLEPSDLYDEKRRTPDLGDRTSRSPQQRAAASRRGKLGRLPARIAGGEKQPELEHDWTETTHYDYVDLDGTVVQRVIRRECDCDGTRHKTFVQRFVNERGQLVTRKPSGWAPALYRAPEVAAAITDGSTVWLMEGEKDADRAADLDLIATTNAQGAGSFPAELAEPLAGGRVHVVLDNDTAGYSRGAELHSLLTELDCTVNLLRPALSDEKADFSDHVDAGHAVDELIGVSVAEAKTWAQAGAAEKAWRALERDLAEAEAHAELRDAGKPPGAMVVAYGPGSEAGEHDRLARRWLAEVEVKLEKLSEAVRVTHVLGLGAGTAFAGEAIAKADQWSRTAAERARVLFERIGVAVPAAIAEQTTTAEPAVPAQSGTADAKRQRVDKSWFNDAVANRRRSTAFRVIGGQIVQITGSRAATDDDDPNIVDEQGKVLEYKSLLSMVVKLQAREFVESEQEEDVEDHELMGRASEQTRPKVGTLRRLSAVRLAYLDPVSYEVMEFRVTADAWADHSWISSLPGSPDYDHKRAGLDTLQRAIVAISTECVDEILYRACGWRENPDGDGHVYVHARGMIGPEGHRYAPTMFDASLGRYDLPDPSTSATELRKAFFEHSLSMLDRLPARVAAPLLGAAWRAAMGHNPWVVTLVGPKGSFKTSIAAKAMHHWGERWSHSKAASSMSGNGDTQNAIRSKLHLAKDTLMWLDDFAPTKGWGKAQELLEETARLVHNQEGRGRMSRDGTGINPGTPPRASALLTSEVMPRSGSSGGDRMLVVPIATKDIDTAKLFPLDESPSRYARALIGSTFISWLAADLDRLRSTYAQVAGEFASGLAQGSSEDIRQAQAIASFWSGWVAMCDFLLHREAISETEREEILTRVRAALTAAAAAAVDPDLPRRTGNRIRELIAYALSQGIAYVDDVRTGDCPDWPLARRLGWTRTVVDDGGFDRPEKIRLDRGKINLGYVLTDPDPARDPRGRVLICESTQLEAVLKAASATQTEQMQIDRITAMRALFDEGILIGGDEGGKLRYTVKQRIHCEGRDARRVVLRLDKIVGAGDEDLFGEPLPDGDRGDDGGGQAVPDPTLGFGDPLPTPDQEPLQQTDDSAEAQLPIPQTEHDEEVDQMADPIELVDAAGNTGWTGASLEQPLPCVVCGQPSAAVVSDLPVHLTCWMRSTPEQRAGTTPAPVTPAPAAPAAPASSAPAQTMPETSSTEAEVEPAGEYTALAAVVDADGIWLSNGERRDLPRLPKDLADLAALGRHLNLGFTHPGKSRRTESGQLWITRPIAEAIGIDMTAFDEGLKPGKNDEPADPIEVVAGLTGDVVAAANGAGWTVGGAGDAMNAWTRVWREDEKVKGLFVVLLPVLQSQAAQLPILDGDPAPEVLARRIGLFATALGFPFQVGGSTTGLNLMKRARRRDDVVRMFQAREFPAPAEQPIEADPNWSRLPVGDEADHEFVVSFDRGGSYLAGASGLELPIGPASHAPQGREFDRRLPGYWKIEIPELGDWRMPNPLDPRGKATGRHLWVTTPSLEFATTTLELDIDVLEAWTWEEHARVLDPWYERIRDARTALDVDDEDAQRARDTLKGVYTAAWGMLGSKRWAEGRDTYQPVWHHLVLAKARTNLIRKIHQIGTTTDRWPVAVRTDAIVYTSPTADPSKSWPGKPADLGRGLGKYKFAGADLLADHLEYLGTGSYRGLERFS